MTISEKCMKCKHNRVFWLDNVCDKCKSGSNYEPIPQKINYGVLSQQAVSIKKVIFNYPMTIVIWSDNTKTIVKCQDGDVYDREKGLAMAIVKRAYGNMGNYYNAIKKWIEPEC